VSNLLPALVLVDDEKAYTAVLSEALAAQLEVPIITFSRPQAALDALPSLEVGLIVTDFFMPQMNGVDFLRRALALKPATPCLILTGHHDAVADETGSDLPELKEVLSKPVASRTLAATIRRYWPRVGAPRIPVA
jgi:two-component SAPR family response regulator